VTLIYDPQKVLDNLYIPDTMTLKHCVPTFTFVKLCDFSATPPALIDQVGETVMPVE